MYSNVSHQYTHLAICSLDMKLISWYPPIIRGVTKKKRDLRHKQFISIPSNKLHGFPFKVIPLESIALNQPSLPRFYALLEGFLWDAP